MTIDTFDDKINRFIIQTAGYKGVHMVASFLNISVATDRQTSDFIRDPRDQAPPHTHI